MADVAAATFRADVLCRKKKICNYKFIILLYLFIFWSQLDKHLLFFLVSSKSDDRTLRPASSLYVEITFILFLLCFHVEPKEDYSNKKHYTRTGGTALGDGQTQQLRQEGNEPLGPVNPSKPKPFLTRVDFD